VLLYVYVSMDPRGLIQINDDDDDDILIANNVDLNECDFLICMLRKDLLTIRLI